MTRYTTVVQLSTIIMFFLIRLPRAAAVAFSGRTPNSPLFLILLVNPREIVSLRPEDLGTISALEV